MYIYIYIYNLYIYDNNVGCCWPSAISWVAGRCHSQGCLTATPGFAGLSAWQSPGVAGRCHAQGCLTAAPDFAGLGAS